MPGTGACGRDQAALFVEPQSRCGDAAAAGDVADGKELGHTARIAAARANFKHT